MGEIRREWVEIVVKVMRSLRKRPKAINEVARELNTGWDTVERCFRLLEKLQYVEKIIEKPIGVYKINTVVRLPDRFIKDIDKIIKKKGTRYPSLEDIVERALEDFIYKEKHIKRY